MSNTDFLIQYLSPVKKSSKASDWLKDFFINIRIVQLIGLFIINKSEYLVVMLEVSYFQYPL